MKLAPHLVIVKMIPLLPMPMAMTVSGIPKMLTLVALTMIAISQLQRHAAPAVEVTQAQAQALAQPTKLVLMIQPLPMHTAMTVSGTPVTQTLVAHSMIAISQLQRHAAPAVEVTQAQALALAEPPELVLMIPLLPIHMAMTVSGTLVTQTPVALTMIVISQLQRHAAPVVEMARAQLLKHALMMTPLLIYTVMIASGMLKTQILVVLTMIVILLLLLPAVLVAEVALAQLLVYVLMIQPLQMHTAMTVSGIPKMLTLAELMMIAILQLLMLAAPVAEVAELALPQELVLIPMLQMMMVMVVLATTICIQKNAVCMIAATSLPQKNAVFADHFVGIILSIFQILK